MGEVTDPAILAMLNGGAAPAGGDPIVKRAPVEKPDKPNLPAGYQIGPDGVTAVRIPGLPADKAADPKVSESERTAGFLATRIVDAVTRLGPVAKKNPDAQAPEWDAEIARGFPIIGGNTAANLFTSSDRQTVAAAQRDILDAALTLGTGAAYNKEQLEGYAQSYLPQLGDSAETIKSKKQALRSLLQSAAGKAGAAAPQIEQAIAALDAIPDEQPAAPEQGGDEDGLVGSVTDDRPAGPGDTPPPSPQGGPSPDAMAIANDRRFYGDPNSLSGLGALARQGVTLGLSDEAAGAGGFLSELIQGRNPIDGYTRERDAARINLDRARDAWPVMGTLAELAGGGGAVKAVAGAAPTVVRTLSEAAGLGALGGYGYGEGAEGSALSAVAGAGMGAGIAGGIMGAGRALAARPRRAPPNVDAEVIAAGQAENVPIRQPDARPDLRNQMAEVDTSKYGGPMVREARAADADAIEQRVSALGGEGNPSDPYALGNRVQDAGKRYIDRTRQEATQKYTAAEQAAEGQRVVPNEAVATIDRHIAELEAQGANNNATVISYLRGLRDDMAPKQTKMEEFLREGNERFLVYRADDGAEADIHLIIGDDGAAEIAINANRKDRSNQFGVPQVRRAMAELKAIYPEIKTFRGGRETGAGPGRVQSVEAGAAANIPPPRDFSITDFQGLRSGARAKIRGDQALTATDATRRLKDVETAFTADAEAQLPKAAATALKGADEFYAGRQEFINGTLKQFLGTKNNPLPAETAAQRIASMTQGKGNYDRFSRMWKELAPEEQADVAATVAHSLGRKANGDFSVSTLIRSLDPSKGINPRTARLLFGDEGAKSLENLRIIARAKNETSAALNNSRTGVVVQEAAGSLKTVLMGGLGFGAAGGPGAVAGVLGREFISKWGEQRAARMLLNPDFTKVLKSIPNTSNPKAVNAWLGRVAGISSIAANDNQAFANAVRASLGASPGRVSAASEQEQN